MSDFNEAMVKHSHKLSRLEKIKLENFHLCTNGRVMFSGTPILERAFRHIDKNNPRVVFHSPELPPSLAPQAALTADISKKLNVFAPTKQFGRTTLTRFKTTTEFKGVTGKFEGVSKKYLKAQETAADLEKELQMQAALRDDPKIRSHFPAPLELKEKKHFFDQKTHSAFLVPEGYYHYLEEEKDRKQFECGLRMAMHDLGYLLKTQGLVFPGLISIFHSTKENRPYSLIPNNINLQRGLYGGFPGDIEQVIGKDLYSNISAVTGLRDVGDLVSLAEYKFKGYEDELRDAPESRKVAHFLSLYLMVATLIIGKRARTFHDWENNHELFNAAIESLLEGLGITLSAEERDYVFLKATAREGKIPATAKFDQQLEVVFTVKKESLYKQALEKTRFPKDSMSIETSRENVVPRSNQDEPLLYASTPPVISKDNQAQTNAFRSLYGTKKLFIHGENLQETFSYDDQHGYGEPSFVGSYSGINPLTTACIHSLRFAQIATSALYNTTNELDHEYELLSKIKNHIEKMADGKINDSNFSTTQFLTHFEKFDHHLLTKLNELFETSKIKTLAKLDEVSKYWELMSNSLKSFSQWRTQEELTQELHQKIDLFTWLIIQHPAHTSEMWNIYTIADKLIGTQAEWQALHDANRINEKTVPAIANQKILPKNLLALTDDAYSAQYPSHDQVSATQLSSIGLVALHTRAAQQTSLNTEASPDATTSHRQ